MTKEQTLPPMDDTSSMSNGQTEADLFDAVLQNSDFAREAGAIQEPLPELEEEEVDPEESYEEEDPSEYEESDTEEESEEEEVEADDEDDDEEESTQDADVYTADDLDLDAKVRVKIDGEELDVSFADLLKGYQTDASLSKKGRELGEARKALEEEREEALSEVRELGKASAAVLVGEEQSLAKQYHDLEAKIEKAREEGDTFEVSELKDKREQVQKKYWDARKKREGLLENLQVQEQKIIQEEWQQQVQYFTETIDEHVPGFNAELANEIRDFALGEGIDEDFVNTIVDPVLVRVLNDYRVLKQGVSKGQAKRKAVPAKKAIPAKKAKTSERKKEDKAKMVKARAFREDASKEDQMDFLRQYAANSLKL